MQVRLPRRQYWGDGWPNIPDERRILVQYPIIRVEKNQLELMMYLMGDVRGGRGRMAKTVVVDTFLENLAFFLFGLCSLRANWIVDR